MGFFESIEANIKMIIKNPRIALASSLNFIPGILFYILILTAWFNFNSKFDFKENLIYVLQTNNFKYIYDEMFSNRQIIQFFLPYIFGLIFIMVVFLVFNLLLDLFYVEASNQYLKGKINMDKSLSKAFKLLPQLLILYFFSFGIFSVIVILFSFFVVIPLIGFFVVIAIIAGFIFFFFTLFMLPVFVVEGKTKGFSTIKNSLVFSCRNFFKIFFTLIIFVFLQMVILNSIMILPYFGYFLAVITELFFTTWIKSMPFFLYIGGKNKVFKSKN